MAMLWAAAWTALWGLCVASFALTRAGPLLAVGSFADLMGYGGWFAFLLFLAGDATARRGRARGWLVPVAIAVVAWGVAAHVVALLDIRLFGDTGRLVLFDTLAAAVLGLVLVEQVIRNVAEESRWSVRPLCLGLAAIFAFDIYTYADGLLFNVIDSDVWSVRGLVRAFAWPLLIVSLVRIKGGALRIVLSREVMFRSSALAMSGLYLLFMAAAGYYVRYFGGAWGRALQIALLAAAVLLLLVLLFSGSMQAKLRVAISKHFFRYRYDYREEWLRFTQALSTHGQHGAMGLQVVRGLADMVESPAGALWLLDASGRTFAPTAQWMMQGGESEDVSGALASFLATRGWVVNLEEYRSFPDRYGDLRLPDWLSEISNAWLVIPLMIGAELTGFVVLATARTPIDVDWEVNDLLKTAGRQAATFLGHTLATEALLEARKFEAFNRLSAFVVHDLKNIVAQLSLMLRNAERHHGNPEFQRDMLMTVEHSVERMKQLMLQLRDGTTPLDATHGIDLVEIAQRVQRAKAAQQPAPELQVDGSRRDARARGPPRARGRPPRAERHRRDAGGWARVD